MSDLLKCPFCGDSDAEMCDGSDCDDGWSVECSACWLTLGTFSTEAEAIAAWNRRTAAAVPGDCVVANIGHAINRAAGDLPYRGELRIVIDRGSATVTAVYAGNGVYFDEDDCSLAEQINNAVQAMLAAAESPK